MAEPYIGEIRMFAGSYPPVGWAFCNGQVISISENDTLFSLIGTTYGGDGQTTFALPDLRGRIPVHTGTLNGMGYPLGARDGVEMVTLVSTQMPAHTHAVNAESTAGAHSPEGHTWAVQPQSAYSTSTANLVKMNNTAVSVVGGSQPHDNMMPSLAVSFIISLYGVYPNQS